MVLKEITSRCNGNPLLSLTLFVNLAQNGFLRLDEVGIFVPTTDFDSSVRLCDYTAIPLPRICVKINCTKVDKSISRITFKAPKDQRPGELDMVMKGLVLLKAAAVIGQ